MIACFLLFPLLFLSWDIGRESKLVVKCLSDLIPSLCNNWSHRAYSNSAQNWPLHKISWKTTRHINDPSQNRNKNIWSLLLGCKKIIKVNVIFFLIMLTHQKLLALLKDEFKSRTEQGLTGFFFFIKWNQLQEAEVNNKNKKQQQNHQGYLKGKNYSRN